MKLKKLLNHIDFSANIKITSYNEKLEEDEELYIGSPLDVPWRVSEMELDTNENYEAVSIEEDSDGKAYINISVIE